MTINLKSTAFGFNQEIPIQYTREGKDVSPSIKLEGIPTNAKSIALICDDTDSKSEKPWVHWVMFNVPAKVSQIPENVSKTSRPKEVSGAVQGKNDFGHIGYDGPMPPKGEKAHHYHLKVFALDDNLKLNEGATRDELEKTMSGHILAQGELVGTYARK